MSKTKIDLTKNISEWFYKTAQQFCGPEYEIVEKDTPGSVLSKINSPNLKKFENYSSWEFRPDIYVILKNKKNSQLKICISNRSDSSLSLKEIGEIRCYAHLVNSAFTMLISPRGTSTEVGILMSDKETRNRLLFFDNKTILVGTWDEKTSLVYSESVIPFEQRELIQKLNASNKHI